MGVGLVNIPFSLAAFIASIVHLDGSQIISGGGQNNCLGGCLNGSVYVSASSLKFCPSAVLSCPVQYVMPCPVLSAVLPCAAVSSLLGCIGLNIVIQWNL